MAINALDRMHFMKTRGPTACSLFLDQIVRSGTKSEEEASRPVRITTEKLMQFFDKVCNDLFSPHLYRLIIYVPHCCCLL